MKSNMFWKIKKENDITIFASICHWNQNNTFKTFHPDTELPLKKIPEHNSLQT